MTTAYIVEIQIDGKSHYARQGQRIGTIPYFFNNASRVKTMIKEASHTGHGNFRYGLNHKDHTKVIQIKFLELGLKQSFATVMTADEFLARDFSTGGLKIPNNPNAVYMIELAQNLGLAKKAAPVYMQIVGQGRPRPKFGYQWQSAGNLRSHITSRLERLAPNSLYRGAKVLEIEMQEDGFTPKQVKTYPIVDFYCASVPCRKNYQEKHGAYNPTSPEFV